MKLHVSVTFYHLFIVMQNTVSDTKLVRSSECAMDEKIQREQIISQLFFSLHCADVPAEPTDQSTQRPAELHVLEVVTQDDALLHDACKNWIKRTSMETAAGVMLGILREEVAFLFLTLILDVDTSEDSPARSICIS